MKGGAIAVPEAFAKYIRSKGGDVVLGTQVEKIVTDNGTATGVCAIKALVDYRALELSEMPLSDGAVQRTGRLTKIV